MTTEEKRRLWLDAFHAEMRGGIKHVESSECNMDELADGCREWADIVVRHAAKLMPDFAEPEREFDRQAAAEQLRSYLVTIREPTAILPPRSSTAKSPA